MCISNRGFSIVESLVAMGIMSVVALSTVSLLYGLKKSTSPEAATCLSYAQATLSQFRAVGQYPLTQNFLPGPLGRTPTPGFSISSIGVSDANRWPSIQVMDLISTPPMLNNYQLVNSAVNAVTSAYNASPVSICSGANGYDVSAVNGVGRMALPQQLQQGTTQVFFKIQPYDVYTGTVLGCTHPLDILPTPAQKYPAGGFFATSGGTPLVQNISSGPTKMANTGLLFRVTVNYQRKTEHGLENDTCASESRFQYEADQIPPQYPDKFEISTTYDLNTSNNSVLINIGYNTNRLKAGSVLVCRDRSMYPGNIAWSPGNALYQNAAATPGAAIRPCYDVPGGTLQFMVLGANFPAVTPKYFPSTSGVGPSDTTGLRYNAGNMVETIGAWRACETVQVCGQGPIPGSALVGNTTPTPYYTNFYTNLPLYCRARIEVGVVDTARNARTNDPVLGGGPTTPANAFPVVETVILDANRDIFGPRYRCNQWCMNTDSSPYPDGYWVMGGTCPF